MNKEVVELTERIIALEHDLRHYHDKSVELAQALQGQKSVEPL